MQKSPAESWDLHNEEKQKKILAALDRFEAWCASQRPFLDDPTYQISQQDKISALLILGVKATVWPPNTEYEDRTTFRLLPPDVARFCDVALPLTQSQKNPKYQKSQ